MSDVVLFVEDAFDSMLLFLFYCNIVGHCGISPLVVLFAWLLV